MVPRLPNSCRIRAGEAARILGRLGPTRVPYLAISSIRVTPNRELAVLTFFSLEILVNRGAVATPISNAYIMGSNTILPTPTVMEMLPIFSATTIRMRTMRWRRKSFISLTSLIKFYNYRETKKQHYINIMTQ